MNDTFKPTSSRETFRHSMEARRHHPLKPTSRYSHRLTWLSFLSLAAVLAWGAGIGGASAAETHMFVNPGPSASIQFATNMLDLGRVAAGKTVRCSFSFTNLGRQVLEIKNVTTSGACRAIDWPRQVEPGGLGNIALQLNTANLDGPIQQSARVLCNDPSQPEVTLELHATVWQAVELTPPRVVFNLDRSAGTNPVAVVRIASRLEEPLEISAPQVGSPNFRAELGTIEAGKLFELRIWPETLGGIARPRFPVVLRTSSTNVPVITVEVRVVRPLSPARAGLGTPARPVSSGALTNIAPGSLLQPKRLDRMPATAGGQQNQPPLPPGVPAGLPLLQPKTLPGSNGTGGATSAGTR